VGAGGGAMDAQHLETCLSSWWTARYWATTLDEYQNTWKDKALERRFQNNDRRTRYRKCISILCVSRKIRNTS
jgi:ATP-dependent Clp protease ATP-binding subunit ClpA